MEKIESAVASVFSAKQTRKAVDFFPSFHKNEQDERIWTAPPVPVGNFIANNQTIDTLRAHNAAHM